MAMWCIQCTWALVIRITFQSLPARNRNRTSNGCDVTPNLWSAWKSKSSAHAVRRNLTENVAEMEYFSKQCARVNGWRCFSCARFISAGQSEMKNKCWYLRSWYTLVLVLLCANSSVHNSNINRTVKRSFSLRWCHRPLLSNRLTPLTHTQKGFQIPGWWNEVGPSLSKWCEWQGFWIFCFQLRSVDAMDLDRRLAVVAIKSVNAPWANSVPIKTPFLPPWGNQSGGHLRPSANINGEEFRPPAASGLAHADLCYGWIWTRRERRPVLGFVFVVSVLHCSRKER